MTFPFLSTTSVPGRLRVLGTVWNCIILNVLVEFAIRRTLEVLPLQSGESLGAVLLFFEHHRVWLGTLEVWVSRTSLCVQVGTLGWEVGCCVRGLCPAYSLRGRPCRGLQLPCPGTFFPCPLTSLGSCPLSPRLLRCAHTHLCCLPVSLSRAPDLNFHPLS